jgi:hypothetical protein
LHLLFLDDAAQKNCSRARVGRLVAVGGLIIDAAKSRALETAIETLCIKSYSFPKGSPFKWSPSKDHWMRDNLTGERREAFYRDALKLGAQHGATGIVTVSDATKGLATGKAANAEMDVLVMTLERFDLALAQDIGLVIVARPSGGRPDEDKFIETCAALLNTGTDYVSFNKLAANVLTMPFDNSRLLQLADLVASISTAMIAGHTEFAGKVFPEVKSLLRTYQGRIGGAGLKLHPDFSYANLYYWILGDQQFKSAKLPIASRPFPNSEHHY